MATIASHGPHTPHPPHAAQHHTPHHHPPRKAAKKHGHGALWAVLAAILVAAGAGWHLANDPGDGLTPEERLVKQMHDATTGSVAPTHTFGGALEVSRDKGVAITAKSVPSKACVSAAWRLAREGVVTINGITPMRISAGKLTELCAEGDGGATLSWAPREQ